MKLINKNYLLALVAISVGVLACKKDSDDYIPPPTQTKVTYRSLEEFYAANQVKAEVFTFNGTQGGTFTTAKGTKVVVKPNSFIDEYGNPVTGSVKLTFKDLYTKSDMLFSGISTVTNNGMLKSAGEFFIKAETGNKALLLAKDSPIEVIQPAINGDLDPDMEPFVFRDTIQDSIPPDSFGTGWVPDPNTKLTSEAGHYIFTLYQFKTPAGNGTWCNSDNQRYFQAYQQTKLTIVPDADQDPKDYHTDVFLIFKGINSMVHVYKDYGTPVTFPFYYAPVGLECTVVALGAKDEKLYSAFVPITITNGKNVTITLKETTSDEFKTKLTSLNN